MSALDEVLNIDTPENVVFGYQVAGIGSRFLAALVDTALIVLLQGIVNLTLIFVAANVLGESLLLLGQSDRLPWLVALFGLVGFAFLWGYYIFFEVLWNGQSPGKRLVGLRTIRREGTPIEVADALIRNLIRIVDFLPFYYGVGVITMFIDGQSRRLGDLAAGSLVVYDRSPLRIDDVAPGQTFSSRGTREESARALPMERLTEDDRALAQRFLQRRHGLQNRGQLAVSLARSMQRKMALPEQPLTEPEAINLLKEVAGQQHPVPGP
jgi:uncharacterized RDD family membrane protein YckC